MGAISTFKTVVRKRDQIQQTLLQWIEDRNMKPGTRLPSQNELAAHFKTTPLTVHRALSELESRGVLHRINGKGTFVGPREPAPPHTLCLILPGKDLDQPDVNPHFWGYVRHLLHAFLRAAGSSWRFTTVAAENTDAPVSSLNDFGPKDVMFFHHCKEPRHVLRELIAAGKTPVVAFGQPAPDVRCLTIDHDPVRGVRRSVAFLVRAGYRRIAFAGSSEPWGRFWIEGYRRGLADHGLPFDADLLFLSAEEQSQDAGRHTAKILLDRGLPCDAVLADADMRALGLVEALREAGVRVPEDVGVMGYDGLDNVTSQPPFMTTLRIPFEHMIQTALRVLALRRTVRSPTRHLEFVGDVLPGQTTRSLHAPDQS